VVTNNYPNRRTREVGDFIVELQPDAPEGHALKLRSVRAEDAGGPSGMVIHLSEVGPLARALLDALADLAGLAVGDPQSSTAAEGDAEP
jgi:hypothetical protein